MAEELSLAVWLGGDKAGRLILDDQHRLVFTYDNGWNVTGFPITPCLPLDIEEGQKAAWAEKARTYFQNLLPEGQALEDVSRALQIDKSSIFGLLHAMGGEASGAIRVIPDAQVDSEERRRIVAPGELSERIRQRRDIPFSVWDGTVRLSIAGYQDKLAVYEDKDSWALVDGAHIASTHILKPDPIAPRLAGLTSNEFTCMKLARAIGLPVAPVRLAFVPEPVLVIERFDRERHGNEVKRIHLLDACQAIGVPPNLKYERPYGDGRDVKHVRSGVGLPRLFELGRWAASPAAFKLQLLRWTIFQVLIGNFDAHAKNISFFWDQRGLRVAPAYDLVSIGIYPEDWFPQTFAMGYGDAFRLEDLSAFEWTHMAYLCSIRPQQVAKELGNITDAVRQHAGDVAKQAVEEGANAKLVTQVIDKAVSVSDAQTLLVSEIPKVDLDLLR